MSTVSLTTTMSPSPTSASSVPKPSLRERKKAKTASSIYDAALELFAERPFSEVSIDDICDRAEVGRASFFRIYGTKAGLLLEFNRRMTVEAQAQIDAMPDGSASGHLRKLAETIASAWASTTPGMAALATEMLADGMGGQMLTAGVSDTAPNVHADLLALAAEIIHQGVLAGEFDIQGVATRVVAFVTITAMATSVADSLMRPERTSVETGVTQALNLVLRGIQGDR